MGARGGLAATDVRLAITGQQIWPGILFHRQEDGRLLISLDIHHCKTPKSKHKNI